MDRSLTVVATALLACCAASAFAFDSHLVIDVADLNLEEKASLITGLEWPRFSNPDRPLANDPVERRSAK